MSDPWDKLTADQNNGYAETKSSYAAFWDYLNMGTRRSIVKLHQHYLKQFATDSLTTVPTTSKSTITNWSIKYQWQRRVDAWDKYQIEKHQEELEKRRAMVIENGWEDYLKARERLEELIKRYPLHKQSQSGYVPDPDNPGKLIKLVTVELALDDQLDLARLIAETDKLGRAAAGLPPDNRTLKIGNIDGETFKTETAGLADSLTEAFSRIQLMRDNRQPPQLPTPPADDEDE